ncbi:MAG TPA: hypothetical protein VI277_04185 [Candidatus Limnocylindria bacterium]
MITQSHEPRAAVAVTLASDYRSDQTQRGSTLGCDSVARVITDAPARRRGIVDD